MAIFEISDIFIRVYRFEADTQAEAEEMFYAAVESDVQPYRMFDEMEVNIVDG